MSKILKSVYRFHWHLIVVAILGCVIWNNIPHHQQQNDGNDGAEEIARHLTQKLHQVGEECSRMTKACYLISDLGVVENEKLVVMRQMILKESQEYCFTNVDLITPEELSYKNADTSRWPINKRTVRLVYAKMMIASGFMMEGLKLTSQKSQDVLMIGLGGGLISNFFSTIPETKVCWTESCFVLDLDRKKCNVQGTSIGIATPAEWNEATSTRHRQGKANSARRRRVGVAAR
ncbi:hypothetical protein Y032_0095g2836 [Ancylostoma ceylanicum]|uniref:Uncharacterized protein n=1 Tax=Ancylostoma ceylanicum TaxID=53326 RepID=A0A016TJT6_9BILA|nr:hypothetical protein Y032_0095g2836 [Ancylostoma ceylanicum]